MPKTLTELHDLVHQAFGIERDFHIQFMDPDFNNEFMNITSVHDIQDRSTIKLVYTQNKRSIIEKNGNILHAGSFLYIVGNLWLVVGAHLQMCFSRSCREKKI